MIQKQDIFNIRFYAKEKFHGSHKGMHYRIEKFTADESDPVLRATVWPGPYNFASTPDDKKTCADFPFSEDGLTQVCAYLNEIYEKQFSSQ